jgi:alpha-1,3-rhamnosyl/mannosyltransferase
MNTRFAVPLRIAIDVSSAAKPDPTGIGRYAVELVRAASALLGPGERLRLVLGPRRWPNRRHVAWLSGLPRVDGPRLLLGPVSALFLGRADIFHATGSALPRGIRALKVATVHDTNTLDDASLASADWVEKRSERRRALARRADMILAVSSFVRSRVLHHFPEIGADRVRVTYHGVDHAGLGPEPDPSDREILARHGIAGRPYVLFVGRVEHRKNPDGLVRGFALARAARDHALVFAGPLGRSTVDEAIREAGVADRVRFLGRFDDRDLGALYRGARAFALPSRYEGFGIPLVEALACGVPSLAADRTSLPEVAGGAALLVDPDSPESIGGALERLLSDEALRSDLEARGLVQAKKFTWRACAEATLEAYKALRAMGAR